MTSVLIVEDDTYKLDGLLEVVNRALVDASITCCRSVQAAVVEICDKNFEFVILDMSLPSHDPEKGSMLGIPRLSGGVEVLFELDYNSKESNVIIVTQYPEIEMSDEMVPLPKVKEFLKGNYNINIRSCVYYDSDSHAWQAEISETIKLLVK